MCVRSHLKSIAKAISWRVVGAIDTFAIAFLITGRTDAAVGVVGLEVLTKSVWYYVHERAWEHPVMVKVFATQKVATH
jgi:uncharacterized membrane protein